MLKRGCEGLNWILVAQDRRRLLVQGNSGIIGFRERRRVSRLTTMSGSLLHEVNTPGLSYFSWTQKRHSRYCRLVRGPHV
jgi:hypothetical protein